MLPSPHSSTATAAAAARPWRWRLRRSRRFFLRLFPAFFSECSLAVYSGNELAMGIISFATGSRRATNNFLARRSFRCFPERCAAICASVYPITQATLINSFPFFVFSFSLPLYLLESHPHGNREQQQQQQLRDADAFSMLHFLECASFSAPFALPRGIPLVVMELL